MAGSYVNGKWFYILSFITTPGLSLHSLPRAKRRALLYDRNPIQLRLEVQMIVFIAIGIEGWSAIRTLIIWIHVFINCEFSFTNSTKNSFRIPFYFIPNLRRMISCFFMTLITGIIFVTTLEFYSNNVKLWMVMLTTGFTINKLSVYFDCIHFAKVRNDLRKKKFL